jgi:hypothetical protein
MAYHVTTFLTGFVRGSVALCALELPFQVALTDIQFNSI